MKIVFTKSAMPLGYAYHTGQEADLEADLARYFIAHQVARLPGQAPDPEPLTQDGESTEDLRAEAAPEKAEPPPAPEKAIPASPGALGDLKTPKKPTKRKN